MRKYWKFLMGALLGGIVGGSLALFFAPNSGEQTRHGIEDYFKNLQNEIQKAGIEKRDELEAQLNQLRSGR